jgi:hypothetical protein
VLTDDVIAQLVARVQNDVGVTIDQDALRRAVGGEV